MYNPHYSNENITREVLPENCSTSQIINLRCTGNVDSTLPLDAFVPSNTRESYREREERRLPNFFTSAHIALIAAIEILLLHLFSSSAGEWHSTQYHMHDERRKTIVKWWAKTAYRLGNLIGKAPRINTEMRTRRAGLHANLQSRGQTKLVKSVEILEGAEGISIQD